MISTQADESWPIIEEVVLRVFRELSERGDGGHTILGPRLDELGWAEIKSDYPVAASEFLFRAQGRYLTTTDCLDRLMLAELATTPGEHADAVLLPGPHEDLPAGAPGRISGIVVGPLRGRIVAPVTGSSDRVSIAVIDAGRLHGQTLDTFDPSVHWTAVSGDWTDVDAVMNAGTDASSCWQRAMAAAQRALATELIAVADQMLDIAVDHAKVRVQFGSPIGAFQSLRHRLADARAHLDGARALTAESWRYGHALSALLAKAAAGRAHRTVADAALQTCGAVGMTAEHDLHRYVRRGIQLDALCGSHRQLEAVLADELLHDPTATEQPLPAIVRCG